MLKAVVNMLFYFVISVGITCLIILVFYFSKNKRKRYSSKKLNFEAKVPNIDKSILETETEEYANKVFGQEKYL